MARIYQIKIISLLLVTSFLVLHGVAWAEQPVSSTQIAGIEVVTADGRPMESVGEVTALLRETFKLLDQLGALPMLPSFFPEGVLGDRPLDYILARIHKLVLQSNEDCDGVMYSAAAEDELATVHVCSLALNYTPLQLASILVHETRHLDGSEIVHSPCMRGRFEGQFSCDRSIDDRYAYAVGLEFTLRLIRSQLLTPETKDSLRRDALIELTQRFNIPPFDFHQIVLLQTLDNQLLVYDGEHATTVPLKVGPKELLVARYGILTRYLPETGEGFLYAFNSRPLPVTHDLLNDHYRKDLTAAEREKVIDMVYTNQYVCLLFEDALECSGQDRKFFRKPINNFKAKAFVPIEHISGHLPQGATFIATTEGEMVGLPAEVEGLKSVSISELKVRPFGAIQIKGLPARQEVFLNPDGTLVMEDHYHKTSKTEALPKLKRLIGPVVYSSKSAVELLWH